MTKLEKRKNVIGGIIMYAIMMLTYIITTISYLVTIVRGYDTAYTWAYFVENILLILGVIAALVIMLVRKRQSGFGVASPMIVSIISETVFLIAIAIQNASTYYRIHPDWSTYLAFLLIIPVVLVIIFFFVPNRPLQIISASVVGVSFLTDFTIRMIEIFRAINRGYFNGRYAFSLLLTLTTMFVLYALIIVQIFVSFKAVKGTFAVAPAPAGYVPQPVPQSIPAVQGVNPVQVKTIPNEQILANFQALLDKGMITQEQFDEKKKELFGEDGQE